MVLRLGLLVPGLLLGLAACSARPPATPDRVVVDQSADAPGAVPSTSESRAPDEPLSMEGAIEWALENNPSLKAQYTKFEAMLQDEPQASSLADPMAMLSHQQAFRGPGDERKNMLTLSQTFPWFGKRGLRGGFARSEALQALEDYRAQALDVRQEVVRNWRLLQYERANRELTRQERDLLNQILQATSALYESGRTDRGALLRVQTELARVEAELPAIDGAIEAQSRELNRLLGAEAGWQIEFDMNNNAEIAVLPERQLLIDEAIASRPELEGMRHRQEAARQSSRLARADYYPDFTIGVGVEGMGQNGSGFYTPDSDSRTDSWLVSVGINIPIPNARRRAATEQARLREQEAARMQESIEDEILAEIHSSVARVEALRQQHTLYDETILALAQEAFEAAETAYRVGRTTYVDLIDVQRTLIAARRDTLRIERDHELAIADLERAVGLPLELVTDAQENRP